MYSPLPHGSQVFDGISHPDSLIYTAFNHDKFGFLPEECLRNLAGSGVAIHEHRLGAVSVNAGEVIIHTTICLADVLSAPSDFFPLTVNSHKRLPIAGRTSGGLFKCKGRARNHEVLNCRLPDRLLRPTMLKAAGIAVALPAVPNSEPVAGVRVGLVDNKFIVNPTTKVMEGSELNLVLAGALQPVFGLLSFCCSESQKEIALLLGQIAATESDCKVHMVQRGVVKPLSDMLQSTNGQLREISEIALRRLAQDSHNQAGIAHKGGLIPLLKFLDSKNGSLQFNAAIGGVGKMVLIVELINKVVKAHGGLSVFADGGGNLGLAPGNLPAAYKSIKKAGGLCIADEVQAGSAHTGFEAHRVVSDIIIMAKDIGNGIPIAAVVTTPAITQVLTQGSYINTFGGNPVCTGSTLLEHTTCTATNSMGENSLASSQLSHLAVESELLVSAELGFADDNRDNFSFIVLQSSGFSGKGVYQPVVDAEVVQVEDGSGEFFLEVVFVLTDASHDHSEVDIGLLFTYVDFFQKPGVQKLIFDELLAICETTIHYQVTNPPLAYVSNIASIMQPYPPEDWLVMSSLACKFHPKTIEMSIRDLSPTNVRIFWEPKNFDRIGFSDLLAMKINTWMPDDRMQFELIHVSYLGDKEMGSRLPQLLIYLGLTITRACDWIDIRYNVYAFGAVSAVGLLGYTKIATFDVMLHTRVERILSTPLMERFVTWPP